MKKPLTDTEHEYLLKLGNRIKAVRLAGKKYSNRDHLAYESDISRSLLMGYEKGQKNISFVNLIKIIKTGFNMKIEEFFSEGFDLPAKKYKFDPTKHEQRFKTKTGKNKSY